jgi:hypothetical protein
MAQAGQLADLISAGVSAQVKDLAPEEVVLVESIPVRHQGFILYGGYLDLAARRMAQMTRTGVPHRILDAAWDRETGQFDATALPDVVLEWDADVSAMHQCCPFGPPGRPIVHKNNEAKTYIAQINAAVASASAADAASLSTVVAMQPPKIDGSKRDKKGSLCVLIGVRFIFRLFRFWVSCRCPQL